MESKRIITLVFFAIVVLAIIYGMGYLIWYGEDVYKGANFSLVFTEILLFVAAACTLVAAIFNVIHHPKSGIKSLIGIGALAILGFIGYTASSGEVLDKYIDFGVTEAFQSKWVDVGLYLMYGTIGIALVVIVAAEINSLLKN